MGGININKEEALLRWRTESSRWWPSINKKLSKGATETVAVAMVSGYTDGNESSCRLKVH